MVTGSHIPADRNGIKFFRPGCELMKDDEPAVKAAVAVARAELYGQEAAKSVFDEHGMLKTAPELPAMNDRGGAEYKARYVDVFGDQALAGRKVVMYQHSAVGRDLVVEI